ncbi:MAG: MFS transporter [Chitinophagaceae bacterium]
MNKTSQRVLSIPVFVAALGYFVDIYDLLLFSIIRVTSLKSLGLTDTQIRDDGEKIISWQMVGLLLGGIIWGIIGDKKGRLSVLFGSIFLYSVANIFNGFVHTVNQYALIRFIAGLGLAGELGAGITLVSELIPKEKRGIATSMVAGLGLTGAILAYFIKQNFDWRTCYFIGGGLGFLLLILRISVFESGMYHEVKKMNVRRGNFFMLFANGERFKRYLLTIFVGLPSWLIVGILLTFSKEFGAAMNMKEPVDAAKSVMYSYVGVSVGGLIIGYVCDWFKSRKKALYLFYAITILFIILFFTVQYNGTASGMYFIAFGLGFGTGFWAVFVTIGAEQFGTNLRATAATTIPNMVRGTLPLMVLLFQFLRDKTNYITGAMLTAIIVMIISSLATIFIKETYGKDLNYVET